MIEAQRFEHRTERKTLRQEIFQCYMLPLPNFGSAFGCLTAAKSTSGSGSTSRSVIRRHAKQRRGRGSSEHAGSHGGLHAASSDEAAEEEKWRLLMAQRNV